MQHTLTTDNGKGLGLPDFDTTPYWLDDNECYPDYESEESIALGNAERDRVFAMLNAEERMLVASIAARSDDEYQDIISMLSVDDSYAVTAFTSLFNS